MEETKILSLGGVITITTERLVILDEVIPIESVNFTYESVERDWFYLIFLAPIALVLLWLGNLWVMLIGAALLVWSVLGIYRRVIRNPNRELHIALHSGEKKIIPSTEKKINRRY